MSSLDVQKDTDDYLLRNIRCTQAYNHSAIVRTEPINVGEALLPCCNPNKAQDCIEYEQDKLCI